MKEERKFEEHWKAELEEAEFTPSDSVWAGIDRQLAQAEGTSLKKRVVFYQRLAAASVLFALLVGVVGVYRWKGDDSLANLKNKTTPQQTNESPTQEKETKQEINQLPSTRSTDKEKVAINNSGEKLEVLRSAEKDQQAVFKKEIQSTKKNKIVLNKQEVAQAPLTDNKSIPNQGDESNPLTPNKDELTPIEIAAIPRAGLLPLVSLDGEPTMSEIFRKLPAISGAFMSKARPKKMDHEHLWASVTAASGSYSTGSNPYSVSGGSAPLSNSSSAGSSYSYGMLAGMRVSNRIVVQSGVQYSNQSIGTSSNINTGSSLAAVANADNALAGPVSYSSSSYNITSAYEFVSVPVQAGYLFIDRKLGLQLNSGVSTDFFIRNTLSDPSGQLQSYSQSAGQDSPYRSVNFSGLMSSEVSYKLGNRYRVSVVPGIRYSFSPLLKSPSSSSGNPMVWDVGFRFRYIFK